MADRLPEVWDLSPHTRAKHEILRRYLGAWLPIMSRYNKRVIFFDGFAGPGVYSKGEPGSPKIALECLLEHRHAAQMSSCEFSYLFNEQEHDRFDSLSRMVDEFRRTGLPPNVHIVLENDSFEQTSEAIIERLRSAGAQLAPTFAFVDPFGYADIPMATLKRLLSFDKCELLVYLDINSLIRFATAGVVDDAFTALMGTEDYRGAPATGVERQVFMRDMYERQLRNECGFAFTRSFLMRGPRNKPICYLFYATRSIAGLAAMKEAMWSVAPIGDYTFSDSSAGQDVLFGLEVDTTPLRQQLCATFSCQATTIETIEQFVVEHTPFLKTHVKTRTLKPLEEEGRITVAPARGKSRRGGTFPPGTRITFV
ncbi:three-Cys-motif partner protein TcmP [Microbacterium sp.]|uniref:three-Cys-motif partner protein TcmP n=1 Tax=Microbacterium sp. TaxID=51671 RepID=UPI0027334472|nr:three-Cys-motif partner protein TcmP [Microbacterium sp.]MDP3950535.1 three-Cys-motif partner protein TcmP [Microbacterium sp.]